MSDPLAADSPGKEDRVARIIQDTNSRLRACKNDIYLLRFGYNSGRAYTDLDWSIIEYFPTSKLVAELQRRAGE